MRVGFRGTQEEMTLAQKAKVGQLLDVLKPDELHHGDSIGADADANALAQALNIPVVLHPPENSAKRAFCLHAVEIRPVLPYLVRNRAIVDETDLLIATPKGFREEVRSETWSTVRYARKRWKTIWIVFPDGSTQLQSGGITDA
jgi:hypothetical protein